MTDAPITYEQATKLWDEGKAAYDAGDFQTAWTTWYGLYGAGITIEKQTQAGMALAIGQALRRLGRFTEAESYFNEAMAAPGADAETQQKAAAGIRQARLENSGDAYDLDDSETGGGITYEQASKLWDEGKAAYDAGDYQTAWTTWYGLYGAGITIAKQTQAGMALAMAQSLRRLGRFTEAESWFNEAMNAPGADAETQQKAAAGIRQARLENSGDAYDLDDA